MNKELFLAKDRHNDEYIYNKEPYLDISGHYYSVDISDVPIKCNGLMEKLNIKENNPSVVKIEVFIDI